MYSIPQCICITFLINCSLVCFHFLDIINRVPMNKAEQVSVENDVMSFGNMPSSGIAWPYGIFIFSFFENSMHLFSQWLH